MQRRSARWPRSALHTATHDPAHISKFLSSFDNGDGLHPNNAGLQAIADTVNLMLFK